MNNNITHPIISCEQIKKSFVIGPTETSVLKNINLTVTAGEQIAIMGRSGTGKSTLLHIIGGLDKPSQGNVSISGINIHDLAEADRCRLRNEQLGFVYQFHHLLPEFSVLENVCMPLLIRKVMPNLAIAQAQELLSKMGLGHRLHHRLAELSGGERQRTAIARALITQPKCLLADEPTGNLDSETADQVYQILLDMNQSLNTSLIIVTHDLALAKKMQRIYEIIDGRLIPH